ncbi:MAG TPA: hypothetical protein VK081_14590, partial [Planctomycetota bacterium]|nr:hypothetical protein [Planctomycetota bacterium]
GEVLAGSAFERFHESFLASRAAVGDTLHYAAVLPALPARGWMQVLVRTISGRIGSMTVDLEDVR